MIMYYKIKKTELALRGAFSYRDKMMLQFVLNMKLTA